MRLDTLYIIGNGFDKFHGLPTSYSDFHKHVSTTNTDLENNFIEYFTFRVNGNRAWTNFEEDLGTFNSELFFNDNCHINLLDDDFRPSFTYSLEDDLNEISEQLISDIRNTFYDWLYTLDLESIQRKLVFNENAFFINFNYTLTLEKIYAINEERILHIHGSINEVPETLVFGHNSILEEMPELDENGDSNRTLFTDSKAASKTLFYQFLKPVNDIIIENNKVFESLCNVKQIFVLGHSLNLIDIPYLKEIFSQTRNATWNVSFYQKSEKEKQLSALNDIGISNKDIRMFKIKSCIKKI